MVYFWFKYLKCLWKLCEGRQFQQIIRNENVRTKANFRPECKKEFPFTVMMQWKLSLIFPVLYAQTRRHICDLEILLNNWSLQIKSMMCLFTSFYLFWGVTMIVEIILINIMLIQIKNWNEVEVLLSRVGVCW